MYLISCFIFKDVNGPSSLHLCEFNVLYCIVLYCCIGLDIIVFYCVVCMYVRFIVLQYIFVYISTLVTVYYIIQDNTKQDNIILDILFYTVLYVCMYVYTFLLYCNVLYWYNLYYVYMYIICIMYSITYCLLLMQFVLYVHIYEFPIELYR